MKKALLLVFISISFCAISQETEFLNSSHLSKKTKEFTLLVLQFEYLDTSTVFFDKRNRLVDPTKTQKYIDHENHHIRGHNRHLEHIFGEYNFSYKLISENELESYNAQDYPYVLKHDLVKLVRRKTKNAKAGFYSYTFHFTDRRTSKDFRDINFYAHSLWKVLHMIVDDMNYFLMNNEDEIESNETLNNE